MAGKKNPRTWGSIRKQSTKSARHQASYIGPDHRRHFAPITFESKMAAERWLIKEREQIEKAAASDDGLASWKSPEARHAEKEAVITLTLTDYATDWIEQRNLKPRTKIGYEASFANYIKPKLGKTPITELTAVTVRSWFAGLGKEHPTRNGHAYGLLHAICNTAVKDGLLDRNPCQIERATSPKKKRQTVVPTLLEVEAIADKLAADGKNARFRLLVLLSAWCGLRWSEVSELRRKDFDKDCAVVDVSRAVTHRLADDGSRCRIDTPKDGKAAYVVIPPHMRDDVKAHLADYVDLDKDALLFVPSRGGCHVNDRVFSKDVFQPTCDALGLSGLTHHSLRHFAGMMTPLAGANLPETMARLRHSTQKASLIYQSQATGRDVAIADALSELRTKQLAAQQNSESTDKRIAG